MTPQTQPTKPKNSSKVNLTISLVFHGLLVLVIAYFAAQSEYGQKILKKIGVEMVKEKPPEKKEPEKPKEPEPPKVEAPKLVTAPKIEAPKEVAAPATSVPTIAPASVEVPAFAFEGGKEVISSSDPVQICKGTVESALRLHWNRPTDLDDSTFVAEVEVAVDRSGKISDPIWKKPSGDKRWDDSVSKAIAATKSINRTPPADFPPRVVVRFDVLQTETINP